MSDKVLAIALCIFLLSSCQENNQKCLHTETYMQPIIVGKVIVLMPMPICTQWSENDTTKA